MPGEFRESAASQALPPLRVDGTKTMHPRNQNTNQEITRETGSLSRYEKCKKTSTVYTLQRYSTGVVAQRVFDVHYIEKVICT